MSDLTPDESAQLAVNGVVTTPEVVWVEASTDPTDLPVLDYQRHMHLITTGDEAAAMKHLQAVARAAYLRGKADR